MKKYIEAGKAAEIISEKLNISLWDLIDVFAEIPTEDVVEVKCRCKDCKHYHRFGKTSLVFEGKNIQSDWCYLRGKTDEEHRMLPTDFCSFGERKGADSNV